MRKIITLLVLAAMLLATLGIGVAAESYMEKEPPTCEYTVEIKKADPSVVKKDGIIDLENGEYVKAVVPYEELSINFRNSANYASADAMAQTMEYYFSWDEVNGFNFAVKYFAKGDGYDGYYTNIPSGAGSSDPNVPQDNFLFDMGLAFASDDHPENNGQSLLYHSIGKTLDGSYLEGWWTQRGNSGSYRAEGGKDFEVSYPGDGSVIYEWSIPFAEFIKETPADGVSFTFTLSATAGIATADNFEAGTWCVSLGQRGGFLVSLADTNAYAIGILSGTPIKESAPVVTTPADTTTVATTPAPTKPATTEVVTSVVTSAVAVTDDKGDVVTNESGDVVTDIVTDIVTSIVTEAPTENAGNGTNSPVTGDPMVIAAVVAAISACGIVVAKKRK